MGKSSTAAFIVFGFSMLGLIIALILQTLYNNEIVVHLAITQADMLPALQTVIILMCILIGIIVAALRS